MSWAKMSADLWEAQAERWDANPNMWFNDPRAEMFDFLCKFVGRREVRIMDLGCGVGTSTQRMKDFGYEAIGVDQSSQMVEYARARGVQAVVSQCDPLPFEDGTFDAVFACTSLEWCHNPSAIIQEIHRVLRPNGSFVAVTLGASASPRKSAFRRLCGEPVIHNMMMPWELRQLCRDAGFNCKAMHGTYNGVPSEAISLLHDDWIAQSALASLWGFGFEK